jgi:hypothetical protein
LAYFGVTVDWSAKLDKNYSDISNLSLKAIPVFSSKEGIAISSAFQNRFHVISRIAIQIQTQFHALLVPIRQMESHGRKVKIADFSIGLGETNHPFLLFLPVRCIQQRFEKSTSC